ncbi:type I-C CRISPR-associated protein Cas8c/Csd1 [soil metagenome]
MILDRLIELRERVPADDIVPESHKRQPIRFILDVSADGRVTGLSETGAKKMDWTALTTPFVKRTSATNPLLLVDKPDYVLGITREGEKPARSEERHETYLDLLRDAYRETGESTLKAVLDALTSPEQNAKARDQLSAHDWKPGDLVVPSVAGAFPHQKPSIQRYWIERQTATQADKSGLTTECLQCGKSKPAVRTEAVELQLGPDRVGVVTGNNAAFLSHGLRQSEIAPMCADCSRAYGEALRFLLQSDEHRLRLANATWLFWTREPVSDLPFGSFFSDPQPSAVASVLSGAWKGHEFQTDANHFYALVVSSNKSRLVVRDWLAVPITEAMDHLGRYFERQRIVGFDGEAPPLKLLALAGATVRDLKDLPTQTTDALLAHALIGRRLPLALLHQAIRRAHADEHPVTRPRAALIRLVLLSNHNSIMANDVLTPDHPEAAYHCGRLLAVLDQIQRRAISPNATLVDRFYGAASTTPALVFGTLLRKAQPHVAKLRSTKGDPYLDRRIGEIAQRIPAFPTTLTPEQQGLFALGFYQEKYRPYEKAADSQTADIDA